MPVFLDRDYFREMSREIQDFKSVATIPEISIETNYLIDQLKDASYRIPWTRVKQDFSFLNEKSHDFIEDRVPVIVRSPVDESVPDVVQLCSEIDLSRFFQLDIDVEEYTVLDDRTYVDEIMIEDHLKTIPNHEDSVKQQLDNLNWLQISLPEKSDDELDQVLRLFPRTDYDCSKFQADIIREIYLGGCDMKALADLPEIESLYFQDDSGHLDDCDANVGHDFSEEEYSTVPLFHESSKASEDLKITVSSCIETESRVNASNAHDVAKVQTVSPYFRNQEGQSSIVNETDLRDGECEPMSLAANLSRRKMYLSRSYELGRGDHSKVAKVPCLRKAGLPTEEYTRRSIPNPSAMIEDEHEIRDLGSIDSNSKCLELTPCPKTTNSPKFDSILNAKDVNADASAKKLVRLPVEKEAKDLRTKNVTRLHPINDFMGIRWGNVSPHESQRVQDVDFGVSDTSEVSPISRDDVKEILVNFDCEYHLTALSAIHNYSKTILEEVQKMGIVNSNHSILTLRPDDTSFLLKQHQKHARIRSESGDRIHSILLSLHLLVKTADMLLECHLLSAVNFLRHSCQENEKMLSYDSVGITMQLLRVYEKNRPLHPKMLWIVENIRKFVCHRKFKILILVKRDFATIGKLLERSLNKTNGITCVVTERFSSDVDYSCNCVITGVIPFDSHEDLRGDRFTHLVEYESADIQNQIYSSFEECFKLRTRKPDDLSDGIPSVNDPEQSGEKYDECTLIASTNITRNCNLLHLLEKKYNVDLVERDYTQKAPGASSGRYAKIFADVIIDERNSALLTSFDTLRNESTFDGLLDVMIGLSLQTHVCWIIIKTDLEDNSLYPATSLRKLDFIASQFDPNDYEIKILYAEDDEDVAKNIHNICQHSFSVKYSWNTDEWRNRSWIVQDVTKHEKILLCFPCINAFIAQAMLSVTRLHLLLNVSKQELSVSCPFIPLKVLNMFHHLVHHKSYIHQRLFSSQMGDGIGVESFEINVNEHQIPANECESSGTDGCINVGIVAPQHGLQEVDLPLFSESPPMDLSSSSDEFQNRSSMQADGNDANNDSANPLKRRRLTFLKIPDNPGQTILSFR